MNSNCSFRQCYLLCREADLDTCVAAGVIIECDPSIKSIIVKIDSENHDFIVEELDDQHLVVKENMVSVLKMKLDEVDMSPCGGYRFCVTRLTGGSDAGLEGDAAGSRGLGGGLGAAADGGAFSRIDVEMPFSRLRCELV